MTIFVSPKPHEAAAWQELVRQAFVPILARRAREAAALAAQGEDAAALDATQDANDLVRPSTPLVSVGE